MNKEEDILKKIAVEQGYVKNTCKLPGDLIMALINSGKNPCDGCNIKDKCKKDSEV